jgi:hypothetical protein
MHRLAAGWRVTMGTRADFYIGRGDSAQWLGSIGYDGYPGGIDAQILDRRNQGDFEAMVSKYIAGRDDGTPPEAGWPWPWETSHTTDFAYMFEDGSVWVSGFGSEWVRIAEWNEIEAMQQAYEEWEDGGQDGPEPLRPRDLNRKGAEVPDMSDRQQVTFGRRSGLIILEA